MARPLAAGSCACGTNCGVAAAKAEEGVAITAVIAANTTTTAGAHCHHSPAVTRVAVASRSNSDQRSTALRA